MFIYYCLINLKFVDLLTAYQGPIVPLNFLLPLQNHTAVGRAGAILGQLSAALYPPVILHAYMHFECMTDHNYSFRCIHCGDSPPVVVIDANKKVAFSVSGKCTRRGNF